MIDHSPSHISLSAALACLGLIATIIPLAAAQPVQNNELEPNNAKTTATLARSLGQGLRPFPIPGPGDTLNGTCIGADVDYFQAQSSGDDKGFFCYSLVNESETGHRASIRGLMQTCNGVIIQGSDIVAQASTEEPSKNIWYGVGSKEQLYIKIEGGTNTTSPYSLKYECTPFRPIAPGPGVGPGMLRIAPFSSMPGIPLDFWVYDEVLRPIPGYGQGSGSPVGFIRNFAPGKYYIMLTDGDFCNNQPKPPDDPNCDGVVLDFPDIFLSSSPLSPIAQLGIEITGNGMTSISSAPKTHPYQVLVFEFNVFDPECPPCAADFNKDGGIDGADIAAFFNAFENAFPCADVDQDGGIGGSDIEYFFHLFEAGGC